MIKQIETYLAQLLPELARRGITLVSQREIPYGVQLRLEREGLSASLNVYYSVKRGISAVPGGSNAKALLGEALGLAAAATQEVPAFHNWERWIGSDECGKGDYFGALVVAAFAVDDQTDAFLRGLGVTDSKKLDGDTVTRIARELYARFRHQIACIVIKPQKYNEIIADMQIQGKNLNDLLAWQHFTVLSELLKRNPESQGVLVDQFSPQKKVRQYFRAKEIAVPVEERTKAERDPAVAAASIIARYQFLQSRQEMDERYEIKFPLGSGRNVFKAAHAFIERYGMHRLNEVAKLHFVTSRKIQQADIFAHN